MDWTPFSEPTKLPEKIKVLLIFLLLLFLNLNPLPKELAI